MQGKTHSSSLFFACANQFPQPCLLSFVRLPVHGFGEFGTIRWLKLCRSIPGLSLHSSTCLFLRRLHPGLLSLRLCNRIWGWLLWSLQHWWVEAGLRIVLAIWLLFSFHIYFRIGFSFCDECYWDFHGIALNLEIAFCKTVIFSLLIHPIPERRRAFHVLLSSSIAFYMVPMFS